MKIRVALPEVEILELYGDINIGGRRYEEVKVISLETKPVKSRYAVFKTSDTGKTFGRFYKRKWELIDIVDDLGSAHKLSNEINGEYRIWVEGWGGNLKVITSNGYWIVDSPLRIKSDGKIKVKNIWVGKGFHWEKKEDLDFIGDFDIYAWGNKVRAVNIVEMEDYISSVIGSEMNPDAPLEALKAQSVAARTNLIKTAQSHHPSEPFDICGEDHCQVYLGLKKVSHETLRASLETKGLILTYNGNPIEARYSKSCGGIIERFSVVWGGEDLPYSVNRYDADFDGYADASSEEGFLKLIDFKDAFCNLEFKGIENLYRWKVEYDEKELVDLIRRFYDINEIKSLKPMKRGPSGRIYELKIESDKGELIIQNEFNIRQVLGKPFLPSSAFKVDKRNGRFILVGCGWGHGVGMCQMGSIGMALKGYTYQDILKHYYPNTELSLYSEELP